MAYIGHIDEDQYAEKALELLHRERESFVTFACASLKSGVPHGETRELLVRKVKSRMENVLFNHLKHTGAVRGSYRHQYYQAGYIRRVRREPQKSDVPSGLLKIEELLPTFQFEIDAMMMEAGKRKLIAEIEAKAKEAQGTED